MDIGNLETYFSGSILRGDILSKDLSVHLLKNFLRILLTTLCSNLVLYSYNKLIGGEPWKLSQKMKIKYIYPRDSEGKIISEIPNLRIIVDTLEIKSWSEFIIEDLLLTLKIKFFEEIFEFFTHEKFFSKIFPLILSLILLQKNR